MVEQISHKPMAEGELARARALLMTRYVSGDVPRMIEAALTELKSQAATICLLRGQTDAHAELNRWVDRLDHPGPYPMSDGEISSIIDLAQGQMVRAQAAEYQRDELLPALKEARDLLLERIHGSPARSAGHNARLVIEGAIAKAEGRANG